MSNYEMKSRIESLWAQGRGPMLIAQEIGCSRQYVAYIVNLMGGRHIPISESVGDHDKHLRLIGAANRGRGFPVCGR